MPNYIHNCTEYYGDFAVTDTSKTAPRVTGEAWENKVLSEYDKEYSSIYFWGENFYAKDFLEPLENEFYRDDDCYYFPELGKLFVLEAPMTGDMGPIFHIGASLGEWIIVYAEPFSY